MRILIVGLALIIIASCSPKIQKMTNDSIVSLPYNQPPAWARKAIWYQIFVERFRNGNPENNPTRESCEGALIDPFPASWAVTPWGHNWYQAEKWVDDTNLPFDRTIQMRRYGGDLAGVEEKIDYLVDLGINAVYFNPLNDAPSLHKYDARYYHHLDVTFGDGVEIDNAIIAKENPAEPSTWQWTTADKKFLNLINKLHERGIKVVLDFSWNHTGSTFWAFEDIKENGANSAFKDWFSGLRFMDNEGNPAFEYDGWYGIRTLPELRKVNSKGKIAGHPYEGNMDENVKNHIYAVCKRWMDPKGDGSCKGGLDGMRLDVAEHVPMGFWREFRQKVREINPEFYLIGENWWTQWPDQLMDPAPWVKGDVFDAVMHYQWYQVARSYFAHTIDQIDLLTFKHRIDSVFTKYPEYTQQAMMNLASSHDSPRLLTDFMNVNRYKAGVKPSEDKEFRTDLPGELTYQRVKLFLLHQFTFVGSPHIWNGDEMGMTGADDPDNRKPLWWEDIIFEKESSSPFSNYQYQDQPLFNKSLHQHFKDLIKLRKTYPELTYGGYHFESLDGAPELLAYTREHAGSEVLVMINTKEVEQTFSSSSLRILAQNIIYKFGESAQFDDKQITLPALSGMVVKLR